MSNPMITGLGALGRSSAAPFALPPINSANGKPYAPQKHKGKVIEDKEKKLEISTGMVLGLAAVLVAANKDQETASHFWNESAKELRLEGVPRKAEWAEWAADNARKNQDSKKMIKNVEEPFIPDADHAEFSKGDVARYRQACDWAKKARENTKGEAPRISGPPVKIEPKIQAPLPDSPRATKTKNKGYWKKGDSDKVATDDKYGKQKSHKHKKHGKKEKPRRYAPLMD